MQDTRRAATLEEFANKKFRYQLSETAIEVERMVIRIENLFIESSSLKPSLLERIRMSLLNLPSMLVENDEKLYSYWNDLNNDFKRLNQNYQDYMRELLWKSCEATLDDMEAELEAVPFDEFAFMRDELVKNKNEDYSFEPHTKTFEAYVSKAKEGKRLLEEEKSQNEKYDRILKTFDKYKSKQDDLEKTEKQCDNLFNEKKERLTEEIYVWEKGNVELHLETEVLQNIEREIENYDENKNYFDIKNIAKPAYEKVSGEIFEDNLRIENEIKSLREEIKEKEEELAEWQNKKDPEPERSESVTKNRDKLKAEGIEYLNFYKTVDKSMKTSL